MRKNTGTIWFYPDLNFALNLNPVSRIKIMIKNPDQDETMLLRELLRFP